MTVKYLGVITMIKLKVTSEEELEHARRQIGELDLSKQWDIKIEEFKSNRSTAQNKRYWRLINELGSFLGYEPEEMHQMMKYKYLSYKQEMLGDEMVVIPTTSQLTIKEFIEYCNNVERFAVGLGFTLDITQHGY
jgi:hypothetical protein